MLTKRYYMICLLLCLMLLVTAFAHAAIMPKKRSVEKVPSFFRFDLPLEESEKTTKVQMVKYDQKLYELAYTTFLQNKNIKNAYTLAVSAVAQQPESRIWRERLAQVAIWHQQPSTALEQYLFLVNRFHDENALQQGKKLAASLNDNEIFAQFLLIDIQNGNNSESNWKLYVDTMLRLGDMQKAIEVLNANKDRMSKEFYLSSTAKIYSMSDDKSLQLKTLDKYVSEIGISPSVAQQLAVIYLNQRDINRAFKVMHDVRDQAKSNDYEFWKDYANVASLVNNTQEELYAYQQLLKLKKTNSDAYIRLIELTSKNKPGLAYDYAIAAKKKYPKNLAITADAFELIVNTKQSLDFPRLLASTPKSVKKQLKYSSSYWNARASYWEQVGNSQEVIHSYLTAMKYIPEDDYLKSDLLSYLMESNDTNRLKKALLMWQADLADRPNMWSAYAQAYARLNQPDMSKLILQRFYNQFSDYKDNPNWLILFKDTLENALFPKDAAELTHYTWPIFLNMLKQQTAAPTYEQLIDYVKLSLQEAGGDPTARALGMLQSHVNNDVELLMLTWALSHNNAGLAKAVYRFYTARGIEAPAWVKLNIALLRNDRRMMRKIITDKKTVVSYRDHILAAQQIDAIPLAQTLAFKSLKNNRHDQDLYDNYFTPVMLKTANNLSLSQEFFQYGSAEGPRTDASLTYFLMPSISLTPYNTVWFAHNISGNAVPQGNDLNPAINQELAFVPARDERAGIKITNVQHRGDLSFDLGYRDNLNQFLTARLIKNYKVFSDLDIIAGLGYHQQADDTLGLYVGGRKNSAELEFNYRLFAKDTISGNYHQSSYFTQDGQYLANGGQATLRYEHKFWKTYPDWTISPYGVVTQYYDKTSAMLTGSVLKLVPSEITPDVNFLIPLNNNEYGLTLSFGQTYIEEYTHSWRPFAAFTLSQNSIVGPGKLLNFGVAGSLIGRDHLLLYYEWGSNQGQGLQTSRLIKISYRIYV